MWSSAIYEFYDWMTDPKVRGSVTLDLIETDIDILMVQSVPSLNYIL